MSMMLNLVDLLLARARRLQSSGRSQDALRVLGQLAEMRDLPPVVVEEVQSRLIEIHLGLGNYAEARRHLAIVLIANPNRGQYHYLLALALEADPCGDAEAALEAYRRALALDPNQAGWLSEFGMLASSYGLEEEALTALARASELAPNDPEILGNYAQGLLEAGRESEAISVLREAMFGHPGDARFRALMDRLRYEITEREQAERRRSRDGAEDFVRMILPFPSLHANETQDGNQTIRHDQASPIRPPHFPRFLRMSGLKHA